MTIRCYFRSILYVSFVVVVFVVLMISGMSYNSEAGNDVTVRSGVTKLTCISIKNGEKTYPTGNPKFSVIEMFPAGISAEEADPFLLSHHFGPTPSSGIETDPDSFPVAWHPHRGMDICTYLIEGVGRHGDSLGNRETYETPGLQWISVGSGIEHAESGGTPAGESMHGFQIWINVPSTAKMEDPAYGTHPPVDLPVLSVSGASGRLLAGKVGDAKGPFKTKQPVEMIDFILPPGVSVAHPIQTIYDNTLIHVYSGSGVICGSQVKKDQVVRLNSETANDDRLLTMTADSSGMKVIIFSGKRIREPIAWHGPFVMNTKAEIDTCIREYRDGKFLKKRVSWDYKRIATKTLQKSDEL